jgi:hypothetical protein
MLDIYHHVAKVVAEEKSIPKDIGMKIVERLSQEETWDSLWRLQLT